MILAVDAMGGDKAPTVVLDGIRIAAERLPDDVEFLLVGHEDVLRDAAGPNGLPPRSVVVHSPESIDMHEHPIEALRAKRNNSISAGIAAVKAHRADAFFSAGNTGAAVAAATLQLGLLPGVQRAGIVVIMPSSKDPVVLMDVGANLNCRPSHLYQYGVMASAMYQDLFEVDAPTVAVLSVGSENSKGSQLVKETRRLLDDGPVNFTGSVEGQDIFRGTVNCVIVEGFTGNAILKVSEALGVELLGKLQSDAADANPEEAPIWRKVLERADKTLDYSETGGAALLGVSAPVFIGHGRSNAKAIASGLRIAAQSARNHLSEHLTRDIAASAAHLDAAIAATSVAVDG